MKKNILIAAFLLTVANEVKSQSADVVKDSIYTRKKGAVTLTVKNMHIIKVVRDSNAIKRDTFNLNRKVLIIVRQKNRPPVFAENLIYSQKYQDSLHIYSRNEALKKFGAKFGALEVFINPTIKLIGLIDIYDSYKVPLKDRGLPVCVDYKQMRYPEKLLAIKDEIISVSIEKDKDGFKFLNIYTTTGKAQELINKNNPNSIIIK